MRFFALILFGLIAISFAEDSGSTDSYYSYDWDESEESMEERILGGSIVTDIKQYSYQVGLINVKQMTAQGYVISNCGGSLIHAQVVLTAAHCVIEPLYVIVFFGTTVQPRSLTSPGSVRVEAENCIVHENYNGTTHENDVAIINLPQPIILSEYVTIIQLATTYDSCFGVGEASGWGQVDTLTSTSELHAVNVSTVNYETCSSYNDAIIRDQHLCIDGSEYKGICSGDSGGPFVRFTDKGERYLCGVSSFIMGSWISDTITDEFGVTSVKCRNNNPKVFASVVYYKNDQWICNNSNQKVGCDNNNDNGGNVEIEDSSNSLDFWENGIRYLYKDDFWHYYVDGVWYYYDYEVGDFYPL